MFVEISTALPEYENSVTVLQQHAQRRGEGYPNLAKTLSYVYLDILRFCHKICMLLSRKPKGNVPNDLSTTLCLCVSCILGLKLKMKFIGRLTWAPVNVQFIAILSKLEEHRKLLKFQLSNASSKEALKFYAMVEEKLLQNDIRIAEPNSHLTDSKKHELGLLGRCRRYVMLLMVKI